jgi:putative ABC transport system permease protein
MKDASFSISGSFRARARAIISLFTILKVLRGGENFTVMTSKQLFTRVSTIIGGITLVLVVVATVSLVVGAIGVMNTMFMSVTERTREIGTLKAVGATKGQILLLFLTEAGALGLIGGLIGIALGTVVAWGVESMAHSSGITLFHVYLGPDLYIGSLLFSFLIGVLSGYLPAKRAADLDPIEALRYE